MTNTSPDAFEEFFINSSSLDYGLNILSVYLWIYEKIVLLHANVRTRKAAINVVYGPPLLTESHRLPVFGDLI